MVKNNGKLRDLDQIELIQSIAIILANQTNRENCSSFRALNCIKYRRNLKKEGNESGYF